MNKEVVDIEEFLERVQDDKELLVELLEIFAEDYQSKRQALNDVIAQKDSEQLRQIAHSLKGASGNISAKALTPIMMQLEERGKEANWDGVDALVVEMDKCYEVLSVEMKRIQQEYS